MIWLSVVFNLCVGLLLAAYMLRAVRRFERNADRLMAKLDRWEAEEIRKFDTARDEIRASMKAKVDAAIAEMGAGHGSSVAPAAAPTLNNPVERPTPLTAISPRPGPPLPTAPAEGS